MDTTLCDKSFMKVTGPSEAMASEHDAIRPQNKPGVTEGSPSVCVSWLLFYSSSGLIPGANAQQQVDCIRVFLDHIVLFDFVQKDERMIHSAVYVV